MARRAVTQVERRADGEVVALCDPGQPWSPRPKPDAVRDILTGEHSYYVPWPEGDTPIVVVDEELGPTLWTDRRTGPRNDLLDLPAC